MLPPLHGKGNSGLLAWALGKKAACPKEEDVPKQNESTGRWSLSLKDSGKGRVEAAFTEQSGGWGPQGLEEAPAASCVGSEGHVIPLPQSP